MSLYQELWTQLPIPGLVICNDNKILEINAATEFFLNVSCKIVVGQHVWNYLRVEDLLLSGIDRARVNQQPIMISDVYAYGRNSAPRQCAAHICMLNGAGTHTFILLIPYDSLGKSEESAYPVTATYSAIGMAEMLAHEIKNPLAGIIGAAQFLSMSLPEQDQEMTELIVGESKRIVTLLDQVEQFGDITLPKFAPMNIHNILDRAAQSATFGFAGNINITKNYDPSLPSVWVDADQMVQVFLNLIKNSCEALGEIGEISVRTFYDPTLRFCLPDTNGQRIPLHVDITDDGPGLPKALDKHVFDPFVSTKSNGKGLGLALVSKLVAQNNGWISVVSCPGKTTFRISLPVEIKI